jgi:hypothetical protein
MVTILAWKLLMIEIIVILVVFELSTKCIFFEKLAFTIYLAFNA